MAMVKGIGVMSPIGYTGTNLEKNFRRGVSQEGKAAWCDATPPLDNLGMDFNAFRTAVTALNGNGSVGLIITVGGLGAAMAAQQYATKPFLSLIGCVTTGFLGTIAGNFRGGINLHTPDDNDDRVDHLNKARKFTASQVCLLVNPNGAMTDSETDSWNKAKPARGRIFTARTDNEIQAAFSAFQGNAALGAMVISADPFFQDHKDILIKAANDAGKHVCYPLQIYANNDVAGRQKPLAGHHTLHGPRLATSYFKLGVKAGIVVRDDVVSTLDRALTEVNER